MSNNIGGAIDPIEWNGSGSSTSVSPRKEYIPRNTSGNNSNENWRRSRLDEDLQTTGDGWRASNYNKWRRFLFFFFFSSNLYVFGFSHIIK